METWSVFLSSLLVGLSIAAPVGPIGLLTIQRSLEHGPRAAGHRPGRRGGRCGVRAIGAYGVSWLVNALVAARVPLALAGGAVLLFVAWQLLRAPLAERAAATGAGARRLALLRRHLRVLTLSNPATIFSFIAIFGAMAGRGASSSPALMVAGVLLGSALWWLPSAPPSVGCASASMRAGGAGVNLASAAVLAGFALWQWRSVAGD